MIRVSLTAMLISVVIPAYNEEQYLGRCLGRRMAVNVVNRFVLRQPPLPFPDIR